MGTLDKMLFLLLLVAFFLPLPLIVLDSYPPKRDFSVSFQAVAPKMHSALFVYCSFFFYSFSMLDILILCKTCLEIKPS